MDTFFPRPSAPHGIALRQADRMAKRMADMTARDRVMEGNVAADHAARMLRALSDAGATDMELQALRDLLTDTFGGVQGRINRMLDEQGLTEDQHQIDVSEVVS